MPNSQTNSTDLRSLLKQGIHLLREAHVPSDTLAAELLLLHVTGRDRTWLYAHPEEPIDTATIENYLVLIRRRTTGEPTQHLTGKQEFWGLEFEVTPDVLIPRPETEHLIEVALDRLAVREIRAGRPPKLAGENLSILDIGTGSGCIAVALAKELSAAQIYATDISPAALTVAQRNATRLGFSTQITFLESDLFSNLSFRSDSSLHRPPVAAARPHSSRQLALSSLRDGSPITSHQSPLLSPLATRHSPLLFDLVISNPPYIPRHEAPSLSIEVRHEPATALYGGEQGYELYGQLIPQAARHLKPGGLLVLELGHDSLPAVRPLLESPEWTNLLVTNDLAGIPRVLSAERTGENPPCH